MRKATIFAALAAQLLVLAGCSQREPATETGTEEKTPIAAKPAPRPNVVQIRAVGKTFEAPAEIASGWTTFQFGNVSNMIHFALIDVPPAGITTQDFNDEIAQPFQDAMDAMNAGDEAAVEAAFGRFPDWIGELGRNGGPGFLSPGRIGQTTIYMAPGHYVLECYVKTDGVFHTTAPGEGEIGMLIDLTVTDEVSDAQEPQANVTLAVRNSGLEVTNGGLRPGKNTIRVNFLEQQALPSFVGNDVHLMRIDGEDSVANADAWLDWRTENGLEDPSPVIFLGGINDMPAGSHGYFTVDLDPGEYAFIAEIPNPLASGFVLPFTVGGDVGGE